MGTGNGSNSFFGLMNGRTDEQVENLRQADRRNHDHDAGAVEQPAQQQL